MRKLQIVMSAHPLGFRKLYRPTDGQNPPKPWIHIEEGVIADCTQSFAKLREKGTRCCYRRDIEYFGILEAMHLELFDLLEGDACGVARNIPGKLHHDPFCVIEGTVLSTLKYRQQILDTEILSQSRTVCK